MKTWIMATWLLVATTLHASDPLDHVKKSVPKSVVVKMSGKQIEFCPDNTCNVFRAAPKTSPADLRAFAYLYLYYFSDYIYLEDMRAQVSAKAAAENLLSRPQFSGCNQTSARDKARCSILQLSRGNRIRLYFVRYDEGGRAVVEENISEEIER